MTTQLRINVQGPALADRFQLSVELAADTGSSTTSRPHSGIGNRPPISRVHNLRGQDN
jgi:hypothetical protein